MGCVGCAGLVLDGAGVTLTRKDSSTTPVVADCICPDRFLGLGLTQIAALPVVCGGRRGLLGDLFEVEGAGAENVTVRGDLTGVERVGLGMSMGRLTLTRDVGAHLGADMSGGEIVVEGTAGDSVGARMVGGRITVCGDAGREVGAHMHGGVILVLGSAGESAGAGMVAGSIVVGGRLGGAPGAGTKRGAIVAFGETSMPPSTFRYAGLDRPAFLTSYLPDLEAAGAAGCLWITEGEFQRFVGDLDSGGEGEVFVLDQS
jgi:formylmethanofuran dehydrogenase subunit C